VLHSAKYVCMCRVMSEEKQGTVKYELSHGGELKCKIKREKTVEHAEWVSENRGIGFGKLVFKKKSPGSLSHCPKTSGFCVDRQTEQVPVLRLSLTSSVSSDRNSQVQSKSWSLCEPEDVGCVSELSPACQLQQSPKDSGIDMSSPPHDDGTVGIEPNVGTGIWSANDSRNGDSAAVEEEKTSAVEKLESAVDNFVSSVHSSTNALWSGAASLSSEIEQPNLQSTLKSRFQHTALKCFPSNSQKLINPLAKTHRVGRYQHMLPVHRIRAESNVSRRSSLEESPTYNMVAPRTNLCSGLPRVKTKLKLLSNNTYTTVNQEVDNSKQQVATQKNKCLNVEKSNGAIVECKRNRVLHKSSVSNAFKNMKVKLCYGDESNQHGLDGDRIPRVPKLKLVVKSERAISDPCVLHWQDKKSVTETVKRDEENVPRHIRRKRRYCETEKMKACSDNMPADIPHLVGSSSAVHLPSRKEADIRISCHKHKSSEAKLAPVANMKRPRKKKKMQGGDEQQTNHVLTSSHSQRLLEEDHIDKTLQSVPDKSSIDGTLSFIHADKLSTEAGQAVVVNDTLNETHTAAQDEAVCTKYTATDESKSPAAASLTELDSHGTGVANSGRVESDKENQCSEDAGCSTERCTVSNHVSENADDDRMVVDGVLEENLYLPDTEEKVPTAMKHNSTIDCSAAYDEQAVINEEPFVVIASVSSDDGPISHTSSDHDMTGETCIAFHEVTKSSAFEQTTPPTSDTVVPLSPSILLPGNNSVKNTTSTVITHSDETDVNKSEVGNLHLTLKSAEVTKDTLCHDTIHSQNTNPVVNNHDPTDSNKPSHQNTECQQDVKQETVDTKELSEKCLELKSVCSASCRDQKPDVGLEQKDSDFAYALYKSSHLTSFSPSYCGIEHTETSVPNSACSRGFLAAFTQFVEKASVKKMPVCCKHTGIETGNSLQLTMEVLSKSGSSQKCVRHRPCVPERRRHSCPDKQALPKSRLQHRAVHHKCTSNVEHIVTEKAASLIETCSSADVDCSKQLTCTAVGSERSTLNREQLLNVVAADRLLVTLRHRVCELVETVLPDFHFPPGFRRDSSSVERLVKHITDILSNSEAHSDVQQCSDPVITLYRMPDMCLQSLQQQVIRLIRLLLPDIDLSEINSDSLDVFLELLTSVNRPLPATVCLSQPNLHRSHETCTRPLDKVHVSGEQLSPCCAETDLKCEQFDTSLSRTESCMPDVDAVFSMPNGLLQINSPGAVGDKRSIRRQVKDCLMFLDRDLT